MNRECDKGYLASPQISTATHAIYVVAVLKTCSSPSTLFLIKRRLKEAFLIVFLS